MGVHKRVKDEARKLKSDTKNQTQEKDKERMYYLYFNRLFSFEEIEQYFRGKYTYKEVRNIIKNYYKDYYERNGGNGI